MRTIQPSLQLKINPRPLRKHLTALLREQVLLWPPRLSLLTSNSLLESRHLLRSSCRLIYSNNAMIFLTVRKSNSWVLQTVSPAWSSQRSLLVSEWSSITMKIQTESARLLIVVKIALTRKRRQTRRHLITRISFPSGCCHQKTVKFSIRTCRNLVIRRIQV